MSNPYIFNEVYPDKDIHDYNPEEAYELGVDTGIHLTDGQKKSLVVLIDKEAEDNETNNDHAYNVYWENVRAILNGGQSYDR